MSIIAIFACDSYKLSHYKMDAPGVQKKYFTWTPRSNKYLPEIDKIVVFNVQGFVKKHLIEFFNINFFGLRKNYVISEYKRIVSSYTFKEPEKIETKHIEELWDLRYLPLEIKALEEGSLSNIRVPVLTVENTDERFYWLSGYIENILSTSLWQPMTVASIAYKYKELFEKYALETVGNVDFCNFQGHDFSYRGLMAGINAVQESGAAHLISFVGTDNIPSVPYLEKYYGADSSKEIIGCSVDASEHSIAETYFNEDGICDESEYVRTIIQDKIPNGIVSIVSDTFDLWKLITEILPKHKDVIMNRNGKVVIRPDCYDEETQILTPSGWKYFKDLDEFDLVAQVHENNTYSFIKPTKIINQEYEGDMYHIRDFHGKVDQLVTPNHRIVDYKDSKNFGILRITEAEKYKVGNWKYDLLRSPKAQSDNKSLTWHERLLIALQADGTFRYEREDGVCKLEFKFQKERKHNRLIEILENLGYEYQVKYYNIREGQSTFYVSVPSNKIVSKIFDWVDISNLDAKWCQEFIEELSNWDSHIRNEGRIKYDTTIKENINIIEIIAISAGMGCLISQYEDKREEYFSDVYTANILESPWVGNQSLTKTKVKYSGNVYCVKVPTGMVLVKRNRGVCVSGNSGNPADILCGTLDYRSIEEYENKKRDYDTPIEKGVIELLWDIFGGTINSKGYKELDSHIGTIYGDSITLELAEEICERLKVKGFASTNWVAGIGSYSYLGKLSRDTFGFAYKLTHITKNGNGINCYKDPITDDGTKKSQKGRVVVLEDENGTYFIDELDFEQEASYKNNLLKTVFKDGKLIRETSLSEIRERINS